MYHKNYFMAIIQRSMLFNEFISNSYVYTNHHWMFYQPVWAMWSRLPLPLQITYSMLVPPTFLQLHPNWWMHAIIWPNHNFYNFLGLIWVSLCMQKWEQLGLFCNQFLFLSFNFSNSSFQNVYCLIINFIFKIKIWLLFET